MKYILSDIDTLGPILQFQLGPQSGIIFKTDLPPGQSSNHALNHMD